MNSERLTKIIVAPVISEKSSNAENNDQVVLKVLNSANKLEIKHAVETLFDVKVTAVTTTNVKGKLKRTGRIIGKRSNWKKAYITLANGYNLNLLGE